MIRVFRRLLVPLSWVYGTVIDLRNWLFDRKFLKTYSSFLPVISVGNITAGGSGKSPFTRYLAKELRLKGYRPVIVSRGYKGRVSGPHLVGPGDTAFTVGDEPIMHSNSTEGNFPVVVARARAEGAVLVEERNLGDVIVLDDGFQHRRLSRSLDIVLIDVTRDTPAKLLSSATLLPSGSFRELPRKSLHRADIIVFMKRSLGGVAEDFAELPNCLSHKMCVSVILRPRRYVDVYSGTEYPLSYFEGRVVNALCAIAKPKSFFELIGELGAKLDATASYADHYPLSERELREALGQGSRPVICTEKDATKLGSFLGQGEQLFFLELEVNFPDKQEEREFLKRVFGEGWGVN